MDKEHNFKIEKKGEHDYLVYSDSKRFGENAIVFEGINYAECLDYIQRHLKPEISYFVINNFSSASQWSMSEEQIEKAKENKWETHHVDTIEQAFELFQKFSDKDMSDMVVNRDTGWVIPEVALGVCVDKMDVCDVIYKSGFGVEMNTDFITCTRISSEDRFKLAYIKDFVSDMNYLLKDCELKINRGRYLNSRGDKIHYGVVRKDFFDELPTCRNYDNYGKSDKELHMETIRE